MSDLRKAAEMALEALETLWDILDDIDTASDMAKENDAWYRKRVEALQKKRWDTTITTDGYKLKGGPVEALRQALAQPEPEPVAIGEEWKPCVKLPIVVHVREQRKGETHVSTREGITPVKEDDLIMRGVAGEEYPIGRELFNSTYTFDTAPVHTIDISQERVDETAKRKHEWVGLTDEEVKKIVDLNTDVDYGYDIWCNGRAVARDVEAKLKEKNT